MEMETNLKSRQWQVIDPSELAGAGCGQGIRGEGGWGLGPGGGGRLGGGRGARRGGAGGDTGLITWGAREQAEPVACLLRQHPEQLVVGDGRAAGEVGGAVERWR